VADVHVERDGSAVPIAAEIALPNEQTEDEAGVELLANLRFHDERCIESPLPTCFQGIAKAVCFPWNV
jgi:hypothetical protein